MKGKTKITCAVFGATAIGALALALAYLHSPGEGLRYGLLACLFVMVCSLVALRRLLRQEKSEEESLAEEGQSLEEGEEK